MVELEEKRRLFHFRAEIRQSGAARSMRRKRNVSMPAIRTARPLMGFGLLHLTISWVFAVVRGGESGRLTFLAPDSIAGFSGILPKMRVPFVKISVNCRLCVLDCRIVTIGNYCPRHSTEHRFNYIQELRTGG